MKNTTLALSNIAHIATLSTRLNTYKIGLGAIYVSLNAATKAEVFTLLNIPQKGRASHRLASNIGNFASRVCTPLSKLNITFTTDLTPDSPKADIAAYGASILGDCETFSDYIKANSPVTPANTAYDEKSQPAVPTKEKAVSTKRNTATATEKANKQSKPPSGTATNVDKTVKAVAQPIAFDAQAEIAKALKGIKLDATTETQVKQAMTMLLAVQANAINPHAQH